MRPVLTETRTVGDRSETTERRAVVGLFLAIATQLTVLVAIAPSIWRRGDAPARPHGALDTLFGNWLMWDGGWYVHIAEYGYSYHPHEQSSVAFFPVYPLVVRLVGAVVPGGVTNAAVLVTMACGLATLVLFHRWCSRRLPRRVAMWAVVAFALYPYAWFLYGAAYSDALFLSATIGAFLLLDDDHPVAAGIVGILATAARPTGIVVLIGLVAVMVDRRGSFRDARARDWGVAIAATGILSWCAWLAIRFGNAFAFIETEGAKGWDRSPGIATWLKFGFFHHLTHDDPHVWLPRLLQAIVCVAFVGAIPAVWRRFGRGYGVYVAAAVLIPAFSTDDFMGTGRYLMAAFPVFALVGTWLVSTRALRWSYVGLASIGLVLGTSLFATGHLLT